MCEPFLRESALGLAMAKTQRGITLIGLLFVGGVLAFGGIIVAQAVPTYLEYRSIQGAVDKAATAGPTVADVRRAFDVAAIPNDIKSIKGADLDVTKNGEKVVVSFAYTREIPIGGPVFLTIKYAGQSK
jgi:hypothetical protein